MKIAFTHNLQLSDSEDEAEFDTPRTVTAISEALARLGHSVEPVEVSGPASRTVARLEFLNPDLIFNTAEGRLGRFREAFYPALFDQLSIPYTGSDAYVCALTLDKQLTKMVVASHGIRTPKWAFVDDLKEWRDPGLKFPVIIKPNYEGSSKGITQDSVVESAGELLARLQSTLSKYPAGLVVEEYIDGRDVVVPYLEKASVGTGGVLAAGEYVINPSVARDRRYQIYDFALKHGQSDAVEVRVPAQLSPALENEIRETSRKIYRVLGVRDLGRIDFRVAADGTLYFIEVNALPSLELGASIYRSAELAGLGSTEEVLNAVLRSAAARQGLNLRTERSRRAQTPLRVGFSYNLKRIVPTREQDDDREAEYDSPKTVEAIREAIESFGHTVIPLEATSELPSILPSIGVDVVFNIAEGLRGRSREAQVPAILELLDIPYTGSDPATLSLSLDKALAKRIVGQAGVPTANFFVMHTGKEKLPRELNFPVVVKPLAEGSSKGVVGTSVAQNESELRDFARELVQRYGQPALVEEYLSGREFTVALLGERKPRALPPMEIVFTNDEQFKLYAFKHKLDATNEIRYDCPAVLDPALAREIERVAKASFTALGCRDVARIDLRLDGKGRVNFIECNPLPGLTPGWSDLCMIAKSAGMDYRTLIGEIMAPVIKRFREKERQRRASRETSPSASASTGASPAGGAVSPTKEGTL